LLSEFSMGFPRIGFALGFAAVLQIAGSDRDIVRGNEGELPTPAAFSADDSAFLLDPASWTPAVLIDQATVMATETSPRVEVLLTGLPENISEGSDAGSVIVVKPDGTSNKLAVSSEGKVAFEADAGLHAAFFLSPSGHAAVPFVVRSGAEVGATAGALPARITVPTFDLAMSRVSRASNSFLPPLSNRPVEQLLDHPLIHTGKIISSRSYRVNLAPGGILQGQLFPLLTQEVFNRKVGGTNILIHRDGTLVARALVDGSGRFEIPNLEEGTYGLIAAGTVGYAAFGFEAIAAPEDSLTAGTDGVDSGDSFTLTAARANSNYVETLINAVSAGDILPVTPIPPQWVPSEMYGGSDDCLSCLNEEHFFEETCDLCGGCGGCASSCSSGGGMAGGGGGAGGFGAGGLLGLAGLAAAIALANDDDDPIPDPATVVFPIVVE